MIEKCNRSLRTVIAVIVFGGSLALLGVNSESAAAQSDAPVFEPSECMFDGLDLGLTSIGGEQLGFECGYVTVPVRHEDPDGPTLRLPVAIRRATSETPRPDPLFLAQGGPGGDAFGIYPILAPSSPVAIDRDLVVFNQRGAQYSEPELSCSETYDALPEILAADTETADQLYIDALEACYARLTAEGVDVSAFNSLQNAADVEAIRRALGYDEYNFYGVSYGTLLGLHLMAQNPDGLRSVILDSVAPTDINFIVEVARSENRAYDALFAACDADPECHDNYPNLEERYFAAVDRLNAEPVTLTLKDADTGEAHEVRFDGTALRGVVFQLLYLPHMYAVFPKLVADIEQGDFRYIESMWPLFAFDQSTSEGMYYSVICAEDGDFNPGDLDLDGLRSQIAEGAREDLQLFLDSCAIWPVEQLPGTVDDPIVSDIPALLLSGAFDPITPPHFADAAAAGLSQATLLLDPTASHGVAFNSECINNILLAFLNDPTTTPDSSCLDEQTLSSAVPPDAITLPVLAKVNSLDSNTVIQASVGGNLLLIVLSAFAIWPLIYFVRAFRNKYPTYDPNARRLRWISRILVLLFGFLAFIFLIGLGGFVAASLFNEAYATAMAVTATAKPVLWIPIFLLILGIGVIISAVLYWLRPGSGSTAGKVYYSVLALAIIGILVLFAMQNLLLPPL